MLEHRKEKIYENARNVVTVACNPSRCHEILAHTVCFVLKQTRGEACVTQQSSSTRNTLSKSAKLESH